MLELLPDQKYRTVPFLSFHQEQATPFTFNGALMQPYIISIVKLNLNFNLLIKIADEYQTIIDKSYIL